MLAYGGITNGLFRGAILESGSATSSSPIPYPNFTTWQDNYDAIVDLTG